MSASVISLALSINVFCSDSSFWSTLSATRSTSVSCSAMSTFMSCARKEIIDMIPTAMMAARNNVDVAAAVLVASVGRDSRRNRVISRCVEYKLSGRANVPLNFIE
jgi:hypothetical protein